MADGLQHYINQGGMELVTFTPSGSWNEAGVRVGKYTFRSFPLPGHPDERFSMFAYPWDLPPDITPAGLRAQSARARRPRRISGSSSSPRNSARAISPSTMR